MSNNLIHRKLKQDIFTQAHQLWNVIKICRNIFPTRSRSFDTESLPSSAPHSSDCTYRQFSIHQNLCIVCWLALMKWERCSFAIQMWVWFSLRIQMHAIQSHGAGTLVNQSFTNLWQVSGGLKYQSILSIVNEEDAVQIIESILEFYSHFAIIWL